MDINFTGSIYNKSDLQEILNYREYNKKLYSYVKQFESDLFSGNFESKFKLNISDMRGAVPDLDKLASKINNCNKVWVMDEYEKQKYRVVKKQYLCGSTFCPNCKKVLQGQLMSKYVPTLRFYDSNIYHLTLTVPNCFGWELGNVLNHMERSFVKLVDFFKSDTFVDWKFLGAFRSTEVTISSDGFTYHPHFHVAVVFLYNDWTKKVNTNVFSFSDRLPWRLGVKAKDLKNYLCNESMSNYHDDASELKVEPSLLYHKFKKPSRILVSKFNREELILQKVWYLIYNGIEVNQYNIDNIHSVRRKLKERIIKNVGYSCTIQKFPSGGYGELFKYMIKDNFYDDKGNKQMITYKQFVYLFIALRRRKNFETYGCFKQRIDDKEGSFIRELSKYKYDSILNFLNKKEVPKSVVVKLELLVNDDKYIYITKRKVFSYLYSVFKEYNLSLTELSNLVYDGVY